jgi:glyoxylase-like metal-dependent hydrolase (beta-lactamase superfamily II)
MLPLRTALVASALVIGLHAAGGDTPSTGSFPARWIDGRNASEPAIQVHEFDSTTWILRQSLRTNREAPFMYLLLGNERALLEDSGAGGADVPGAVLPILQKHRKKLGVEKYPLVVAHSHSHGDHVAGDAEFRKLPDVSVVGLKPEEVAAFFNMKDWPRGTATYDLGGRKLEILAIPGHEPSSIAIYDPQTHVLLTGDTMYPGRVYVADAKVLLESAERLVAFSQSRPVSFLLGTHIEMTTTPKKDFPYTALQRDNEHPLQLDPKNLVELRNGLREMLTRPVRTHLDHFVIFPVKN